jgi:hypothetical protein
MQKGGLREGWWREIDLSTVIAVIRLNRRDKKDGRTRVTVHLA